MPAGRPPTSESCGAKATKRGTTMLNKTKIALAAALVIGTASTALAAGFVPPGSTDGVNPAYHPRWFPDYPGFNNPPTGNPYSFPPGFNAAGHVYYPTATPAFHASYSTPGCA